MPDHRHNYQSHHSAHDCGLLQCGCLCLSCCTDTLQGRVCHNATTDNPCLPGELTCFNTQAHKKFLCMRALGFAFAYARQQPAKSELRSSVSQHLGPLWYAAGSYDDCTQYDTTQCGFQYSDSGQAAFCPVPQPSSWPALMQVFSPSRACMFIASCIFQQAALHTLFMAKQCSASLFPHQLAYTSCWLYPLLGCVAHDLL